MLENIAHYRPAVIGVDFAVALRASDRRISALEALDVRKYAKLAECVTAIDYRMREPVKSMANHAP